MREDYDCPMCPGCDEELDENNYCEERIKLIDDRYWTFAVPVEEEE